jgi:aerobic C4-dicarboxylate transport protein
MASIPRTAPATGRRRRDRTHRLYLAVVAAVLLGIAVGFAFPEFATSLKWLGTAFVDLIKMLIAPVIFCTIVLGIGSIRKASQVGRVGGLALGYFLVMSTVALAIGLVVGNVLHPGDGLHLTQALRARAHRGERRDDGLPARHHPHLAALGPDRRLGAADPARRAPRRLRDPGHGPHR